MNHQVTDHYDSESILRDNMVVASLDMSETNGKKKLKCIQVTRLIMHQ